MVPRCAPTSHRPPEPRVVNDSHRNLWVAGGVLACHAAVLWALQNGLAMRVADVVTPVRVIAEVLLPPPPAPVRRTPAPPPAPSSAQQRSPTPPQPQPLPRADPAPVVEAAAAVADAAPVVSVVAPVAAPSAGPAPAPMPPRIELPSSDADYLHNPKPAYPPLSKRMGEQGKVLIRVLISAEGALLEASVAQSSGYDRLDQAALAAVLQWRFVPGKRNGVPVQMAHHVPLNFVLE